MTPLGFGMEPSETEVWDMYHVHSVQMNSSPHWMTHERELHKSHIRYAFETFTTLYIVYPICLSYYIRKRMTRVFPYIVPCIIKFSSTCPKTKATREAKWEAFVNWARDQATECFCFQTWHGLSAASWYGGKRTKQTSTYPAYRSSESDASGYFFLTTFSSLFIFARCKTHLIYTCPTCVNAAGQISQFFRTAFLPVAFLAIRNMVDFEKPMYTIFIYIYIFINQK